MTPSRELLLECARGPTPRDPDRIRRCLAGDVDWEEVLSAAGIHAVEPVLARALDVVEWDGVPKQVRDALTVRARSIAEENLRATAELLRVLDVLGAGGIQAIPYKGPALAAQVYGDLALRRFVDLDLLVRESEVMSAVEVLGGAGYRFPQSVQPSSAQRYLRSQNEFGLVHGELGQIVEIQWRIVPRSFAIDVDVEGMRRRLRPVPLGGRTVPGFDPADLLLLLCVHGAKHLWERLGWIVDVAELLAAYPRLDWRAARRRARGIGADRILLVGLGLAEELVGAPLPEPVRRTVRSDAAVRKLVGALGEGLFGSLDRERPVRTIDLQMRERLRDRARHLVLLALTPTAGDMEAVRLPSRLAFLYYGVRPVRLTASALASGPRASRQA